MRTGGLPARLFFFDAAAKADTAPKETAMTSTQSEISRMSLC